MLINWHFIFTWHIYILNENEIRTVNGGRIYLCNEISKDPSLINRKFSLPGTEINPYVIIYFTCPGNQNDEYFLVSTNNITSFVSLDPKEILSNKDKEFLIVKHENRLYSFLDNIYNDYEFKYYEI